MKRMIAMAVALMLAMTGVLALAEGKKTLRD